MLTYYVHIQIGAAHVHFDKGERILRLVDEHVATENYPLVRVNRFQLSPHYFEVEIGLLDSLSVDHSVILDYEQEVRHVWASDHSVFQ